MDPPSITRHGLSDPSTSTPMSQSLPGWTWWLQVRDFQAPELGMPGMVLSLLSTAGSLVPPKKDRDPQWVAETAESRDLVICGEGKEENETPGNDKKRTSVGTKNTCDGLFLSWPPALQGCLRSAGWLVDTPGLYTQ